jgi:hypothetical protein
VIKGSIGFSTLLTATEAGFFVVRKRVDLQFKGFAGGVPQNTERTTVKPWVGI